MDIFRVLLVLFSRSFNQLFLSFRSRKFVTPLFGILRSYGIFILAKCCGSFNKFNTYFLRSLDSSLFFRKWIFYTGDEKTQTYSEEVVIMI